MTRPNILWILSDQHNADAWGGAIQTPALDALSAEGTTFGHAYCQGPLCVPARASLLTERYVSEHGVRDNRWQQTGELPTVVQRIRDAGYRTTAIGKMHLYRYPPDVRDGRETMRQHGFSEAYEILGKYGVIGGTSAYTEELEERGLLAGYREFLAERDPHHGAPGDRVPHWTTDPAPLPADAHPDAWVGRRTADWIRDYRGTEPFFLWAGFPGPHDPWDAPAEYTDRYDPAEIPLPRSLTPPEPATGDFGRYVDAIRRYCTSETVDLDVIRRVRRHYYGAVTMIDHWIGAIVDALAARPDLANTWIVYSSDHGEMLGEHRMFTKWLFHEPSVRVPLIIRPPGGQSPIRYDELVEHLDLSATLAELAGAPPLPDADGRSLLPAVSGDLRPIRDVVRSECETFGMWRTRDCKLVVDEQTRTPVQLFDLQRDPDEDHDVHADPGYADVVREMMDTHVRPDLARSHGPG
ncbi:sulfatase family protein [Amycolatopsis jejuensis]|uniref:sulfatase family protein n=1 Tax=Amycolatopsis jejuensis TaxID=330084 RepID=UPI000525180E|nr:sulfatase-like hydrolase/transferase [Amycolatopsis jejuensis]